MKKIVVTGAAGFIGRNLLEWLGRRQDVVCAAFDLDAKQDALDAALAGADVVYHLAGVNRPPSPDDYEAGNAGAARDITERLDRLGSRPLVVLSSSAQAALDNPYGRSKRLSEEIVAHWAERSGASAVIFRLPNVFGKWCRPDYNSAVATFCHNIARDLPITVSDRANALSLVYVDDAARVFLGLLDSPQPGGCRFQEAVPVFNTTLGEIVDRLRAFRSSRTDLVVPDFADPLIKRLYATYLSYLPEGEFAYALDKKEDPRGSLAELLKSRSFGQIFVSRTKPGVTRGNHYHDTKTEKFCVLEGEAVVRFRAIQGETVTTYRLSGTEFRVLDIPPGYTHSIENVGDGEMVVLFWASEPFDPDAPDTYPAQVERSR